MMSNRARGVSSRVISTGDIGTSIVYPIFALQCKGLSRRRPISGPAPPSFDPLPSSRVGRLTPRLRRATRIQIVPVQNRVEREEIRALRLPAPERTGREYDDVCLTERDVDDLRAVRQHLATHERARQQHGVRTGGE